MDLIYRKPTKKEYQEIFKLIKKATKSYEDLPQREYTPHTIENLQKNPRRRKYRVLVYDNKIVGFLAWKKKFAV